jgi:hypothetical protein
MTIAGVGEGGTAMAVFDCCRRERGEGRGGRVGRSTFLY